MGFRLSDLMQSTLANICGSGCVVLSWGLVHIISPWVISLTSALNRGGLIIRTELTQLMYIQ